MSTLAYSLVEKTKSTPYDEAGSSQTSVDQSPHWPSGVWLVPSIVLGILGWVWIIAQLTGN